MELTGRCLSASARAATPGSPMTLPAKERVCRFYVSVNWLHVMNTESIGLTAPCRKVSETALTPTSLITLTPRSSLCSSYIIARECRSICIYVRMCGRNGTYSAALESVSQVFSSRIAYLIAMQIECLECLFET